MLEFTVILEWLLGKTTEAYVIIALLVFNAVVGFLQEDKANKAVELLRRRLAIRTRVKRDGKWIQIEAKELVPGDVIRLRAGDISPGDSVLADGNLEVDQSALTGESLTVERIIDDPLYSGSIVKIGEATTVVT
jgi:H+-transporting ATPase